MKFILPVVLFVHAFVVHAEEVPQWEFGMGVGGLSIPHYRGSDQRKNYLAPIPYLRYNGKRLKVDREGGRFFFYDSAVTKLDVSAAFSFPVDSKDNEAREGMPDLQPVLEVGPRVQFYLYESEDRATRFRIGLPLRMAIATNIKKTNNIGWVFSPYIQLRYYRYWESAVSIGPLWATESYHDYFYQIDPQYATPDRPVYDARGGYSGSRITVSATKRFDKIWFGMFARYDNLAGAVFRDSALVKQDDSFMVGFALSWVFAKSRTTVPLQ